ncbi:MAG TPA: hypothetical protein VMX97_09480 [Hyphomicrobiaceae bacterium]|nr:hypothetical protein [Hyphomicrobiaceae bacterium]
MATKTGIWRVGGGRLLSMLVPLAAVVGFTGCAGPGSNAAPSPKAGLACVDDSPRCIDQRRIALQSIMGDRSRRWIKQPPTAAAYASGVRLFAFMKQRRSLNCHELQTGYGEAKAARPVLRAAASQGLTPAQISRGAMLGDEVAGQLKREIRRRGCRG